MSWRRTPRASAWLTTFSMTPQMCSTSSRLPWKALLAVTVPRISAIGWMPRSRAASAASTTSAAAPIPMIMPCRRLSNGSAAFSTTSSVAAAPEARKPEPIHSIRCSEVASSPEMTMTRRQRPALIQSCAIAIAQDWINAGRCRRVIVISGDDATSEHLMEWIGSGFLASGAAATDDVVENAALPFDNRRHGMIIGMGAAALVVEAAEAARERGIQPIAEILGTVTANSAFHGSRLDVEHICGVMENVVSQAEARGVRRHDIAPETVFVSHETYTPARGGSAAAEINALRSVFGADADRIVIANTKGFTGHPMAVGVEDITAVKMLETGIIPPIPNFKEIDPALGALNLSSGGAYPVQYALRLAAGFGSQISMALFRWTPMPDRGRRSPENLGYLYRIIDPAAWQDWLTRMTGYPDAQLEVVQRRLRVADVGTAAVAA